MRPRAFILIVASCSALLLSAGTPSMAQIAAVPSIGSSLSGAAAAAGAFSVAVPSLGPSLSVAAPLFSAAPPAVPAAVAAFPAPTAVPAASVPVSAAASNREHALTGDVRFIYDFRSEALDNSRTVAVYLPPGYDSSNERYPVLYMQDGQNLFDAAAAHGGNEWGLDETADRLMRSGELPPFIIVAAYNTDARISEYTTVPDPQYGGGHGDAYGEFLIKELKPAIDSNLRTLPDAEHTGIMGSSLGGLISLDLGLSHPDVFSRIGGPSASLWWAGGELTRRLAASPVSGVRPRVWIDMGTREGEHPDARVEEVLGLGEVLKSRGWREGDDLAVRVIDGGTHDERAWRQRSAEILKFLFPVGPRP
jgi:predicted alpha/beta superfamily hydrolase